MISQEHALDTEGFEIPVSHEQARAKYNSLPQVLAYGTSILKDLHSRVCYQEGRDQFYPRPSGGIPNVLVVIECKQLLRDEACTLVTDLECRNTNSKNGNHEWIMVYCTNCAFIACDRCWNIIDGHHSQTHSKEKRQRRDGGGQ